MESKEAIIKATIELIKEKGEKVEAITVREICKRAGVGLGLVNYHFKGKEKLIEQCVEYLINEIVENFSSIRENTTDLPPLEKLEYLGNITLDYLFKHPAVSKISMLSDMSSPKENDNTNRTYQAYLPLVAACRSDWNETTVKRKTFYLISIMQQMFLRQNEFMQTQGIDLTDKAVREKFHKEVLHDILEV